MRRQDHDKGTHLSKASHFVLKAWLFRGALCTFSTLKTWIKWWHTVSYSTESIYCVIGLFLLTSYNAPVPVGCALMQNAVTHLDTNRLIRKKEIWEKNLRDHVWCFASSSRVPAKPELFNVKATRKVSIWIDKNTSMVFMLVESKAD